MNERIVKQKQKKHHKRSISTNEECLSQQNDQQNDNLSNQHHHPMNPSDEILLSNTPLTSGHSSWHYFYIFHLYKHLLLCLLWGSMSLVIGISLVTLSALIRSKTTSISLLESLPIYIPGLVLCVNGLSMLIFMFSKTRRFVLLKSIFALYLLSIIFLCVIIFSEWSVHLPKISKHRFCVYNQYSHQCSCTESNTYGTTSNISQINNNKNDSVSVYEKHISSFKHENTVRTSQIVFENIQNCQNVHDVLNNSLRVILALSIVAIPVCLFSIWTLFRLHKHEYSKQFFKKQQQKQHHLHNDQQFYQSRNLSQLPTKPKTKLENSTQNHQKPPTATPIVNDCLSPKFSSRDHLIIDSSNHFRSNGFDDTLQSDRPRIWSSQFSGFSQNCDAGSESEKGSLHHRLRRVVSVMFDNKSRQNWSRWNLFRRKDSSSTNSASTKQHHHSQTLLPPPHASRLFALNNSSILSNNNQNEFFLQNCAPLGRFSGENLNQSFVYLSTSPSSSSSSLSSKTRTSFTSRNPNSDPFPADFLMQETNFNEPANPSLADSVPKNDDAVKWALPELTPQPDVEVVPANFHEQYQQNFVSNEEYRSNYHHEEEEQQEPEEQNLDPEVDFEHLILSEQIATPEPERVFFENISTPLETPILASEQIDEYFTTFEEAFKNYYDSQHRISEYQFHTLPVNKPRSKNRTKRKTIVRDDIKLVMPIMSDDEFPPIEPPADYQNQTFIGVDLSQENQQFENDILPGTFQSQDQPDWFYQIIAEMNRIQKHQINDLHLQVNGFVDQFENNHKSCDNDPADDDDDDVENVDDDDDDDDEDYDDEAGDTSTSQDIAEFELELDDESLKITEEVNSYQESTQYAKRTNSIASVIEAFPVNFNEQIFQQQQLSKPSNDRFKIENAQNQILHSHYIFNQNHLTYQTHQRIENPLQVSSNLFQPIKSSLRPLNLHQNNQTTEDDDDNDDDNPNDNDPNDHDHDDEADDDENEDDENENDENTKNNKNNENNHKNDLINEHFYTGTDSDPESVQDSSSQTVGSYVAPPKPFTSFHSK